MSDFCFYLCLAGLVYYTFNLQQTKIEDVNQEFILTPGSSAKIWSYGTIINCTVTPISKWAKIQLLRSNVPLTNAEHITIIYKKICLTIENGDYIKSHENNIKVICSEKCY